MTDADNQQCKLAAFGWPFTLIALSINSSLSIVTYCNKVSLYVTQYILTKQIVTECKTHRFIIKYMLYFIYPLEFLLDIC